jgi:hypothetical protein
MCRRNTLSPSPLFVFIRSGPGVLPDEPGGPRRRFFVLPEKILVQSP